jgi:anaerobic carbon-monoxide dehydrogenase iron sulfur subunit
VKRIYANEEVCIGCRLCEVHCIVQHSQSKDIIKAFKRESPRPLPKLTVQESGETSFALQCRQCEEPHCVYSCLTGALDRQPNGAITHDVDRCIGCWTCVLNCPNGAIRRDERGGRKVASRCDLCPDLETPACVANCPNGALECREEEN